MSPLYVRPYVKVRKTDDRDAEGIAEAATRPTMTFVTVKSEEPLDLQAIHRVRERLAQERTRLVNQARGFLMEGGLRPVQGRHAFQRALRDLTSEGAGELSPRIFEILRGMACELDGFNDWIAALYKESASIAREDAHMRRLMTIPGIGPAIATALVAAIGQGDGFRKARDLSAWLGLVPRQVTTDGKATLIGISKRGNSYLRKLFIHGARAVLHLVRDRSSRLTCWADDLKERTYANVAEVAAANKRARIASAVLTKEERYTSTALTTT